MIWLWLFLACTDSDNKQHETEEKKDQWKKEPPAVLVKSEIVGAGEVADFIEITGSLESVSQVNIIPEATGHVQQLLVREGDQVQKGDLLAKLINPNVVAALERSEIEVSKLGHELQQAQKLHAQGAISDRELAETQNALKTASASNIEAKSANSNTQIKSPIDGVVASVNIRQGELATTTQLFQIVDPNRLRLVAAVPERDLHFLKENQQVTIFASYDSKQSVEGIVERIAPVVDPTSGSIKVFINLQEGQLLLRPGQFVKAQVEVDRHRNTTVIPKTAVVYEDGSPIAYVIEEVIEEYRPDKTQSDESQEELTNGVDENEASTSKSKTKTKMLADRRVLELGYTDNDWAEILSGVEQGEQVITIGNNNLEDDTPVTLEIQIPPKTDEQDSQDGSQSKDSEESEK